jgi:hypothetical protein
VSFGVVFECVLVGGIARENTVDLKAKRMEAVEGCKKKFVGGKLRIMNGEIKG